MTWSVIYVIGWIVCWASLAYLDERFLDVRFGIRLGPACGYLSIFWPAFVIMLIGIVADAAIGEIPRRIAKRHRQKDTK